MGAGKLVESSSVEVRLCLQYLAQWLGAFSQRQVTECQAAIEALGRHGSTLCENPEFRRLFEACCPDPADNDPEPALRAMCAFLAALTGTASYNHSRAGV